MESYVRRVWLAEDDDDQSFLDVEQLYECDTGGVVWDAGLVLISYLRKLARLPGGARARALDLGSGTGVVGMALCKLGLVQSVMLTDTPAQLDLIRRNVQLNFPEGARLEVTKLCWEDTTDADVVLAGNAAPFSLILASDCVYGNKSSAPLVTLLLRLLRANPAAVVVISFEKRPRHASEVAAGADHSSEFFSMMRAARCDVRCIPHSEHGDVQAEEIFIYFITLPVED
jgi:predicted nicotinamide N-methyase